MFSTNFRLSRGTAWKTFLRLFLIVVVVEILQQPAAAQKDSPSPKLSIGGLVESSAENVDRLTAKLRRCQSAGQDIRLPDATLAVAELFLRFARSDIQANEQRAQTLRSMQYVDAILDSALREADAVLNGDAQYPRIPDWNVIGLDVREGSFWSGKEPVFLTGFNWNAEWARSEPQLMKRLGVNLVDGMLRGALTESGELDEGWYQSRSKKTLDQMQQENFAVDAMLSIGPPDWLHKKHPDLKSPGYGHYTHYAIDHPAFVAYRLEVLDRLVPLYARHKALLAIDLMNEPAYQGTCAYTFANWRAWLHEKYGSIQKVNEAWATEFTDFEAIDLFPTQPEKRTHEWQRARVDWTKPGTRGMHLDWCLFNMRRVTKHFQAAHERIRHHAPHVSTHVKAMLSNYFTGSTEQRGWPMRISYNTFGIDLEAINHLCGVSGGDDSFRDLTATETPNRYFGNTPYVAGWLNSGMAIDLLRSISPDKPFYNSEFHAVEAVDSEDNLPIPAEHMRLALWHSHLHGMNANLLWYMGRTPDGAINQQGKHWFDDSLLDQPWLLHVYVTESLNLRRFVPQVTAFARSPRKVCVLYSDTSAIQDVETIDTLRDTYEALNFLGVPIGFVTERQLAADWLDSSAGQQTRLLLVPNAIFVTAETVRLLQKVSEANIDVRLIGKDCLLKTPVGKLREVPILTNSQALDLGSPQDYHLRFNEWLQQAKIERELVALDSQGNPAWGIEVRTVRAGNQRLAYLINLLRTPVDVQLRWNAQGVTFRTLETEQVVPNTLTLQPRQVVFGPY